MPEKISVFRSPEDAVRYAVSPPARMIGESEET
jgi:hypothetical protein